MISRQSMSIYSVLVVGLVLLLAPGVSAHQSSELKRAGVDWYHASSPFSLELSVGLLGTDGLDDVRPTFTLAPRFDLGRWKRSSFSLALPVTVVAGDVSLGWTDEVIWDGVRAQELELGSTVMLVPSIEWTSCRRPCFQPSLFLGAGVRVDRGRSVEVGDFGSFTTEDSTRPVLTAGAAWGAPLSPKLTFRLEIGLLTTFYDDIQVETPGGGEVSVDGGTVTSTRMSFGFRRRF